MLEIIAEGLQFPESPLWSAGDGCLYLVEWTGGRILAVRDGQVTTLFETEKGGGPSGLGQDSQGNFWVTLYDARKVVRYTSAGAILQTIFAYKGVPFKGPCDLVLDASDGVYFTDSGDFGEDWTTGRPAGAVYYLAPAGSSKSSQAGSLSRVSPLASTGPFLLQVDRDLHFPNGIALSPDGGYLYVNEHRRNRTLRYTRQPGGHFAQRCIFFQYDSACLLEAEMAFELGPDGMCVDEAGNLWVAHYGGGKVVKLSAQGDLLAQARLPRGRKPSSTAFHLQEQTLYITEAEQGLLYRGRITG
jgi:gluconolactonase